MSFGIIVAGILIGAIGTIAFIILSIIALASGNRKNTITFSTLFVMCLIIAILSVAEMVTRVAQKVKSGVNNIAEKVDEIKEDNEKETREYREWLRSIAPEQYRDSLDNDFFDTFDQEKNVYCVPMVYPYRLEMNTVYEGHARLSVVKGIPPADIAGLEAITEAAFDKSFLLMKRDYSKSDVRPAADAPEVSYILFEFSTGKSTVLYNKQKLMEEAEKAGYTGKKELEEIDELYYKLI